MVKAALEAVLGVKTVPAPLAWALALIAVLLLVAGTGAAIREIAGWLPRGRRRRTAEETPQLGARDFLALGSELAEEFGRAFNPFQQAHERFRSAYKKYRPKYEAEEASNRPDKYVRGQKIIKQMASEMNQQLDLMEAALPEIEASAARIAQAFRSIGDYARERSTDRPGLIGTRRQIAGFLKTLNKEKEVGAGYQRIADSIRSISTIDTDAVGIRSTRINDRIRASFAAMRVSCRKSILIFWLLLLFGRPYRMLRRLGVVPLR
jgi:hypothetical protein